MVVQVRSHPDEAVIGTKEIRSCLAGLRPETIVVIPGRLYYVEMHSVGAARWGMVAIVRSPDSRLPLLSEFETEAQESANGPIDEALMSVIFRSLLGIPVP